MKISGILFPLGKGKYFARKKAFMIKGFISLVFIFLSLYLFRFFAGVSVKEKRKIQNFGFLSLEQYMICPNIAIKVYLSVNLNLSDI